MSSKASGDGTGYVRNKAQWFFEDKVFPGIIAEDLSDLAFEMSHQLDDHGWTSETVDWDAVEEGLRNFLAGQAGPIINALREELKNR